MRQGLLVRVWFLAVLCLCSELGSCQQTTQPLVEVASRVSSIMQAIKEGESGVAPFISLIQVLAETANKVIEQRAGGQLGAVDAVDGAVSALELGQDNVTLTVSRTFVDDFFHMNDLTDSSKVSNNLNLMSTVLLCVAFVAFLGFAIGLIGAFQIAFDRVRNKASTTLQIAYWAIFMLMSGYVMLTSVETTVWNKILQYSSQLMWGTTPDPTSADAIFGLGVSSGVSSGVSLGVTLPVGLDGLEPVFCNTAFSTSNPQLNRYPVGSVVYQYNQRRLATMNVEEYPELQYIQSLLDDPNYPPAAGGITTTMARAFGGISNECEEFNGDVVQCCNETNCQLAVDPDICLQQRCPGKVLFAMGADEHCRCVEITSKLGLQVEYKQLSMCSTQAQHWLSNNLVQDNAAAARAALAADLGCTGNFDASIATLQGPITSQPYMMSAFSDKSDWGASSSFISLNTGGNSSTATVTFPLSSCIGAKAHSFRVRYANLLATPVYMQVTFDNLPVTLLTFPAGSTTTTTLKTDVVFRIPNPTAGDHRLAFLGQAGGMPVLHRLAVCTDSTDYCSNAF